MTVTAVEMSRDLAQANVFVSIYGSDDDRATTMEGLESVATGLRGRVGRALHLRIETLLAGLKPAPAPADAPDQQNKPGSTPEGTDDGR